MYTSADGNNMRFSITNSFTISTDTNYMRRRREGEREGGRKRGREEREGGEGGREEKEGGREERKERGREGDQVKNVRYMYMCTFHVFSASLTQTLAVPVLIPDTNTSSPC